MPSLVPRLDALQAQAQNMCINGGMDFWQRGTSFSSIANAAYAADRWKFRKATTTATQNVTRSTDVPTLAQAGAQLSYSYMVTQTATTDSTVDAGDLLGIQHILEGSDYAVIHGQKIRVQFWVKASIAGVYPVSFTNSALDRSYVTQFTVNSANTWEREVIDITMDSSGTWLFDNGVGVRMHIGLMCGSTYRTATTNQWISGEFYGTSAVTMVNFAGTSGATFNLAGVAIIPGDFVTAGASGVELPFKRVGKTIGDELRLCQRYRLHLSSCIGAGCSNSSGAAQIVVSFKNEMRGSPTLSTIGTVYCNDGTSQISNTITGARLTSDGAMLNMSGLAANRGVYMYGNTNPTDYVAFDAEL